MDHSNHYELWKYGVLYHRRMFYFRILSVILVLSWSYIYYNIVHGILELKLAVLVPLILCIIHIILLITMFTSWGKSIMNKAQGYKFCVWCSLSISLNMCFLVIPTTENLIERYVMMSFLSSICVTLFHQLGVSQNMTLALQSFLVVIWSFNIWQWDIGALVSIILLFCQFTLTLTSTIQDYEMKRTYTLDSNIKFKQSDITETPVVEVTKTLHLLHDSLNELQTFMNKANMASKYVQEENRYYWTPIFASLHESRYYCLALFTAIKTDIIEKHIALTQIKQFAFSRICEKLFVIFESVAENSLSLFLDDTASEVFITAQQGLFELLLFLLMQDAVYNPNQAICVVETECIEDKWYITATISTLLNDRVNTNTNDNINNVFLTKEEPKEKPSTNVFAEIGEKLLPIIEEETVKTNATFTLRLADIIAHKYFDTNIVAPVPDANPDSNLRIMKRTFKLPEDGTSVVQGMSSAQYNQVTLRHHWLFIEQVGGDDENISYLKEKFSLLRVPLAICQIYQLSKLTEKYRIAVISDSILIKFHLQLCKDIAAVALKLVVISDSKSMPPIYFYNTYGISVAACIPSRASIREIFNCIQNVTKKLDPRLIIDDKSGDVISLKHRHTFEVNYIRKLRNENYQIEESQPLQCIELITRFQLLTKEHFGGDEFTTTYVLDDCVQRITNVQKDFIVIPDNIDDEELMDLSNLKPEKKKVKFVIKIFYPTIEILRATLSPTVDLLKLLSLTISYSEKAKQYGFNQLCCFYDILGDFTRIAQLLLQEKTNEPTVHEPFLPPKNAITDEEKVLRFLQKMIDEIEKNVLDLFRVVR